MEPVEVNNIGVTVFFIVFIYIFLAMFAGIFVSNDLDHDEIVFRLVFWLPVLFILLIKNIITGAIKFFKGLL